MSLRGFHIFFITFVTLLFAGTAYWSFMMTTEQSISVKVLGILSVVAVIAFPVYGVYFLKKAKKFMSPQS